MLQVTSASLLSRVQLGCMVLDFLAPVQNSPLAGVHWAKLVNIISSQMLGQESSEISETLRYVRAFFASFSSECNTSLPA